ncbi:nitroreductase/quinone reductase family protein [Phycicoccus sonneratiae]|uniref:Nitroreductase family deazaflavin-dependent oxidoreductase n=1 Tax=Phycicoccus sonneratiae TaxID=2807628 RepID=A0ABS2CLL9_9MICO|nr:nitroreductase/quinone reductase family protein [Phycicoccus sonneraticus]MBM6400771.1 nitroreductase family deazaflavin-dependent oxidoreductase [Phycicoccus sonneraticus]
MQWPLRVAGAVVAGVVLLPVAHVLAWRARWQPGLDLLRRIHRRVRPLMMGSAGRPGRELAAVHHTGRRTGRPYATPVWAHRVGDAFYVGLPYGTTTDWVRNVRAAGGCVVERDGVRHEVAAPSFVGLDGLPPELGPRRAGFRRLGVTTFLRLEVRSPATAS